MKLNKPLNKNLEMKYIYCLPVETIQREVCSLDIITDKRILKNPKQIISSWKFRRKKFPECLASVALTIDVSSSIIDDNWKREQNKKFISTAERLSLSHTLVWNGFFRLKEDKKEFDIDTNVINNIFFHLTKHAHLTFIR